MLAVTSSTWDWLTLMPAILLAILVIVILVNVQKAAKAERKVSTKRQVIFLIVGLTLFSAFMFGVIQSISATGRENQAAYRKGEAQRVKDDRVRLARSKPAREAAAKLLANCWPGAKIDPKLIELSKGSARSTYTVKYPDGTQIIVLVANNDILNGPCKK